jgi:hypothetical protein
MKKNVGIIDKVIRLLIAALIIILYFFTDLIPGTLGIVLLVFAGVFVLTSLLNFCPIWAIFKLSTAKKE